MLPASINQMKKRKKKEKKFMANPASLSTGPPSPFTSRRCHCSPEPKPASPSPDLDPPWPDLDPPWPDLDRQRRTEPSSRATAGRLSHWALSVEKTRRGAPPPCPRLRLYLAGRHLARNHAGRAPPPCRALGRISPAATSPAPMPEERHRPALPAPPKERRRLALPAPPE